MGQDEEQIKLMSHIMLHPLLAQPLMACSAVAKLSETCLQCRRLHLLLIAGTAPSRLQVKRLPRKWSAPQGQIADRALDQESADSNDKWAMVSC